MFYSLADGRHHAASPATSRGDIERREPQPRRQAARGAGQRRRPRRAALLRRRQPSTSCRRRRCPTAASPRRDFHPRLPLLAFALNEQQGPEPDRHARPGRRRARSAWTRPYAPPGVDTARFAEQQIVRWKSFDGREISGIAQPAAGALRRQAAGADRHPRRPRGPGAEFGFLGRNNYFIEELGIAVIQPNVRGSERLRQDLPLARRRHASARTRSRTSAPCSTGSRPSRGLDAGARGRHRAAATAAT